MMYFTPDLFARLNSSRNDAVSRAEREWEDAVQRYRKHFARIAADLPEELRRFCSEVYPHDAEIIGLTKGSAAALRRRSAELFTRQANKLLVITYSLLEKPLLQKPLESAVFYEAQPIWLYDEVDMPKPAVFSHEILISNGYVFKFLFKQFEYDEFQIVHPVREKSLATA